MLRKGSKQCVYSVLFGTNKHHGIHYFTNKYIRIKILRRVLALQPKFKKAIIKLWSTHRRVECLQKIVFLGESETRGAEETCNFFYITEKLFLPKYK